MHVWIRHKLNVRYIVSNMAQNTNYFSNNSKTINEKSEVEKVQFKYDLESKAYPINQSINGMWSKYFPV